MKMAYWLWLVYLCILIFQGCASATDQFNVGRITHRVYFGDHEAYITGYRVGSSFVSEHPVATQSIAMLLPPVTCENSKIFNLSPREGMTWLDAMLYCDIIRSNSVAKGALKKGEIVRLPTINEVVEIYQNKNNASLWFFNGISNGVPPSTFCINPVYEWTSEIVETNVLSIACFRHEPVKKSASQVLSVDAFSAYPNFVMRLVITPEDETYKKCRENAKMGERQVWNLDRKQRYNWIPFRDNGCIKNPGLQQYCEP